MDRFLTTAEMACGNHPNVVALVQRDAPKATKVSQPMAVCFRPNRYISFWAMTICRRFGRVIGHPPLRA